MPPHRQAVAVGCNLDSYFLPTYYMTFSSYVDSNWFRFKVRYVLPIIASLLTYVVIGQLYTSSLSENDLVSSSGQVSVIKQDIFLHDNGIYIHDNNSRDTTKRVSIKLLNSNDDYFIFDNTNGDVYELIKQNVSIGDKVSILHRTQLQYIIGFGNEFQIFKFEKGGDVLYTFDKARQTFGAINIFEVTIMLGLWFLYFYFRHILKMRNKQQPT
jgi:hypothetical protein